MVVSSAVPIFRILTCIQIFTILVSDILNDSETHKETYLKEENGPAKKRAFIALQRSLVKCQELGDEKLHLLTVMNEIIENRTRQLEQDRENLGMFEMKIEKIVLPCYSTIIGRYR